MGDGTHQYTYKYGYIYKYIHRYIHIADIGDDDEQTRDLHLCKLHFLYIELREREAIEGEVAIRSSTEKTKD